MTKARATGTTGGAKGALVVGTGSTTAAPLTAGTDGYMLYADSTATTGIKWAAAPASGGMTLISETVASGLSSLALSSIPQTYKQLLLVWDGIYHGGNGSAFNLRLNNDSTNGNYSYNVMTADYNNGIATISGTTDSIEPAYIKAPFGYYSSNSALQNAIKGNLLIDNYSSTTKYKYMYGTWSGLYNTNALWYNVVNTVYNGSTSAITSINIVDTAGGGQTFSNATNTSIRLYGIS
jgi:hypothetical protein